MKDILQERLRFLLRDLREPAPSEESERRALAAFKRRAQQAGRPGDRGGPGQQDRG